jgi:hypothetical protein
MDHYRHFIYGIWSTTIVITATCKNQPCGQYDINYNFYGDPAEVQCGECGIDCELTDPQPDPTPPEPIEP